MRDVAAEYSKRWSTIKHYTPGQRVLVRKQPGQSYVQEGVVVHAIADHTYEIKIGGAYRRYNLSHLKTLHDNLELGLEDIDVNSGYNETGVQGVPNVKTEPSIVIPKESENKQPGMTRKSSCTILPPKRLMYEWKTS